MNISTVAVFEEDEVVGITSKTEKNNEIIVNINYNNIHFDNVKRNNCNKDNDTNLTTKYKTEFKNNTMYLNQRGKIMQAYARVQPDANDSFLYYLPVHECRDPDH